MDFTTYRGPLNDAEHHVHPGLPHWMIARSAVDEVAPPVLDWLKRMLDLAG